MFLISVLSDFSQVSGQVPSFGPMAQKLNLYSPGSPLIKKRIAASCLATSSPPNFVLPLYEDGCLKSDHARMALLPVSDAGIVVIGGAT